MLGNIRPRITNLSLRGLALGSRLLLIVALAKFLTPAEVGLYGLFAATISFSMLVIGGDFYTYSQRELLSSTQERRSFVLQHQILATAILYVFLLPLQGLIFWLEIMPKEWALWFFALLISEHIAQEINRLLTAIQCQISASIVLFLRVGLWAWIIVPLMWLDTLSRSLEPVFTAWFIGSVLASMLGGTIIWQRAKPWRRWHIDAAWIKRGLSVGLTFLVATMSFRALQTVDRYAVEHFAGVDFLGVYVVYAGMAMTVINVLDPAVFSFLYPRLVSCYRSGDLMSYRATIRELAISSTGLSVIVAISIAAAAPYLFLWIGNPIYGQQLEILWLLLGMAVIYAIGMTPHYGLYACGADKSIMFAHITALIVFVATTGLTGPYFPRASAPLGLIGAFCWMALFKSWRYLKLNATASGDTLQAGRTRS